VTTLLNLVAALSYALGGVMMKRSDGFRNLGASVLLFICFAIGATVQTFALKRQPLGSGYVIVLGLEAVAALALGARLYKEPLDATKLVAAALVVAGIVLLRRS
jgi:quaternary ammonium compound-resistance protein SugE